MRTIRYFDDFPLFHLKVIKIQECQLIGETHSTTAMCIRKIELKNWWNMLTPKNGHVTGKNFHVRENADICNENTKNTKIQFLSSICEFIAIYHQITRFIQGYVDNEVNLNADKSCKQTCSDYTSTKNFGCAEKTLCKEYSHIDEASIRCKGSIYNCDFVDDDVTVCPVNKITEINWTVLYTKCDRKTLQFVDLQLIWLIFGVIFELQALQKLGTRRYDYVRFTNGKENGKTFGKYDSCLQTAHVMIFKLFSFFIFYLFSFVLIHWTDKITYDYAWILCTGRILDQVVRQVQQLFLFLRWGERTLRSIFQLTWCHIEYQRESVNQKSKENSIPWFSFSYIGKIK